MKMWKINIEVVAFAVFLINSTSREELFQKVSNRLKYFIFYVASNVFYEFHAKKQLKLFINKTMIYNYCWAKAPANSHNNVNKLCAFVQTK
jgi:hypothetical protein